MPTAFPGFDAIFQIHDPLLDEPYRGRFAVPPAAVESIILGERIPSEPIEIQPGMGGDEPWEVIWAHQVGPVAVADAVLDVLRAGGATGWSTYPVIVFDRKGGILSGYSGLAVTGRCGPIDYGRSHLVGADTLLPDYVGLYFDPDSWDGSDLFFTDRGRPFCTASVKEALERAGVRNLAFTPLPEVRTPQIAVGGIPDNKVR
jgi:hypothetical protein